MELDKVAQGGKLVISIRGRLDASGSERFQDFALKQIKTAGCIIVIDAGGLTFLSSMGIRSLLVVHKKLHAIGGGLEIINATDEVRSVLNMSGFSQWLGKKLNIKA